MNKYKYLEQLSNRINGRLPVDEYNNVMQYYSEYFADAGVEKELEVMEELGSPQELAQKIIAEYRGKLPEDQIPVASDKKKLSIGWVIFIAIVGAPLWIALFGIGIGVIVSIFAVLVSFGAVALAGAFTSVFFIIGGIVLLFSNLGTGLLTIGAGFIMAAVGIGFMMLTVLITNLFMKLINLIFQKSKKRRASL